MDARAKPAHDDFWLLYWTLNSEKLTFVNPSSVPRLAP